MRVARRRSPTRVAIWALVVVLGGFLIAVAAGVISDRSSSKLLPTITATVALPGMVGGPAPWPDQTTFTGHYRVGGDRPTAGTSTTRGGAGSAGSAISGTLNLFMRTVKRTEPRQLSGILALDGPGGDELVYLTLLTAPRPGQLHAEVNGGSYFGPVIGSFAGRRVGASLTGTLNLPGYRDTGVRISRVSR